MQPNSNLPLFPTITKLISIAEFGKSYSAVSVTVPVSENNMHALAPTTLLFLKRGARTLPPTPGSVRAVMIEKLKELPVDFEGPSKDMPAIEDAHAQTIAAFQALAALGTVAPQRSEISAIALNDAGLHAETFLAAYTSELKHENHVLYQIDGVNDQLINISALTGKACAQVMEHRYFPIHKQPSCHLPVNNFLEYYSPFSPE